MPIRSCAALPRGVFVIGLWLASVPTARASHLALDLTVEGRPAPARAGTDTSPPAGGTKPRPVVKLRRDEPVRLRWSMRNTDRDRKLENLLVHLFVVRQEKPGQKEVPDPRQGAIWESAFATALDPGKGTNGALEVPIDEPGIYLVRIESQFTEQDHEHFAAVDVQVE
jgi:hypothetical protein